MACLGNVFPLSYSCHIGLICLPAQFIPAGDMYHKSTLSSPGIDFNTPTLKQYRARRLLKDHLARWGVAAGGVGVILAILLIFLYLLYEVMPLFSGARMVPVASYPASTSAIFVSLDAQAEMAMETLKSGRLRFFATRSGVLLHDDSLPLPTGSTVEQVVTDAGRSGLMAAGLSNGGVVLFEQGYQLTDSDDRIAPEIRYPFGRRPFLMTRSSTPLTTLAISNGEERLLVAGHVDNQVVLTAFAKSKSLLAEAIAGEPSSVVLPTVTGEIKQLLIDPEQNWLYVLSDSNRLTVINIRDIEHPVVQQTLALTAPGVAVTDMAFLSGGISVLVGDSQGSITQWFMVRGDEGWALSPVRSLRIGNDPVNKIVPEHGRKGFLAADVNGTVGLFYTTSSRTLLTEPLAHERIDLMAVSPQGDYLLLVSAGKMQFFAVDNPHPEISWSALWGKVWYESYPQADYIWQSATGNNDVEAKLSLVPLVFGTLKAAFYAMLLATPLAIGAAIYTGYFMAPALRHRVKPVIEQMAALPTVILGFMAAVWLAPQIESHLVGIFALLLLLPAGILLFALCWDLLPLAHRLRAGGQAMLLVPVVLACGALAMMLGECLEAWLFAGDMSTWLTVALGIPFDQRNALVIGMAMGFAVIPTIFSIAEEAIFSVPRHLTCGSLALGATPWQTLSRVVIVTASSGIFAAVMIGMTRVVGETMIVLMATGNTPITEVNIFQGMRTLAASIAVEIPEAEVRSTHYRMLFLAALVLFVFTFVVNGVVDLMRYRLRQKYSSF